MGTPVLAVLSHLSNGLSRLRNGLSARGEIVIFWCLTVLYLLPVWTYQYLPTQDGPAHLDNAQILKEYGNSAVGYETFFELREELLPNLSSHVLLAALLYLFPPLLAEKVLVSLYVVGFAGSYRYFLGAFASRCQPLSWAGLLLVYHFCFWKGFYNHCLCLILLWIIVGYCVRRRGELHLPQALVLMLLFTAAYFTHLVGFLLAFAGAIGTSILVPPRRFLATGLIVMAGLPAAGLSMDYFEQTGFFQDRFAMRVLHDPLAHLIGTKNDIDLRRELVALDNDLFAYHARTPFPFSIVLPAYLALLAICAAIEYRSPPKNEPASPGRLFPAVLGLLLLGGYLLLPNHLGFAHGGFLKSRLAPLPFLVWLARLREPASPRIRWLVRGLTVSLLAVNLLMVYRTVQIGNQELAEYTAGIETVGSGHRLYVAQAEPHPPRLVNPLTHAAHYYCLGTGNLSLDNYEASVPHFPVKYRDGVIRGRGIWPGHPTADMVDTVLCWKTIPGDGRPAVASWAEIFHDGPLRIYRRTKGPDQSRR